MCPNDFVLHNFGNLPAPSSWLTVTASLTNCCLINYAALRTIKQFELPRFRPLECCACAQDNHRCPIRCCLSENNKNIKHIHLYTCLLQRVDGKRAERCRRRRLRHCREHLYQFATDTHCDNLDKSLSQRGALFSFAPSLIQILYLAPISPLCWAIALCSLLYASNRSRSIPIAIVQLQREAFACQTSESASLRLGSGSGLPP